jgi:proline dehydrogenase
VRSVVLSVAHEPHVEAFITHGPGRVLAQRFVAGETLEQALAVVEGLAARHARVSLDYLGESVRTFDEATNAASIYRETIRRLRQVDAPVSLSLKPTQFGLDLAADRALALLADVVAEAARVPLGVRLDMEDSSHVDGTLALAEALRRQRLPVGVVLQAALYRTPGDLEATIAAGGAVRLCKGAYAEPTWVAYPRKADVDLAYAALLARLLDYAATRPAAAPGQLPVAAIATHDERMIERAIDQIHRLRLEPGQYEFQMLYGVRRDLQDRLLGQGYPLRIYTPWGPAWYPYLSRRLAERPANLMFMATALLSEARAGRSPTPTATPSTPVRKP